MVTVLPPATRRAFGLATTTLLIVVATQVQCVVPPPPSPPRAPGPPAGDPNCNVQSLRKSELQGLRVYSPDERTFLVNKEDERGTAQIYIATSGTALKCITCAQQPGGPKPERMKMQPVWHPSGRWIFLAVERDKYSPPPILGLSRKYVEGQLQSGIFTNMYAVSPDGTRWHRLSDFKSGVKGTPDGFTGPAFTPDGRQAVWSQIVDGNILRYRPFGRWELILADFQERRGVPGYTNLRNITPRDMHWNEPGNFSPDGVSLVLTGSTDQQDAQGQDQYILDIRTGRLTNLTNTPRVWDEHGVFTADGEKIIFMSAYPYRSDPAASQVLGIKTEFMLMRKDGSGLSQLTHFREPGHPEHPSGIAAVATWSPDGRTAYLATLLFPKYEYWDMVFQGPCGRSAAR
jgi:hypothetical protein